MTQQLAKLSTDINVITAEINAYQRVAGEAIFEIGKRLKHVKENDLAHGEFGDWADSIGIGRYQVSRFIKVAEELRGAKLQTSANIGLDALYLIATMPEPARTETHTLADGQTKTPDEMTVRELREVKAALKAEQARREQAEAQAATAQRSEVTLRVHKFDTTIFTVSAF